MPYKNGLKGKLLSKGTSEEKNLEGKVREKAREGQDSIRLVLYLDHLVKRPLLTGCFHLFVLLWFTWVLISFNGYNLSYENCQDSRVDLILSSLFYLVFLVF